METRAEAKPVQEEKTEAKTETKPEAKLEKKPDPTISFIDAKIFLQKELNLIAGRKIPADDKVHSNKKLAAKVRNTLTSDDERNPAIITRNLKEVFEDAFESNQGKAYIPSPTLKINIEAISENCASRVREVPYLYLERLLIELHRYKSRVRESQYEDFYFHAANCLNGQAGTWAAKHKGWSEAYNYATNPIISQTTVEESKSETVKAEEAKQKKKDDVSATSVIAVLATFGVFATVGACVIGKAAFVAGGEILRKTFGPGN